MTVGQNLVSELKKVLGSGISLMGTMSWGLSCAVLLETVRENPEETHIHYFTLVLETEEDVLITCLLSREGNKKTVVRIEEVDIPEERSILFDNFYRELNRAKEWAVSRIEGLV